MEVLSTGLTPQDEGQSEITLTDSTCFLTTTNSTISSSHNTLPPQSPLHSSIASDWWNPGPCPSLAVSSFRDAFDRVQIEVGLKDHIEGFVVSMSCVELPMEIKMQIVPDFLKDLERRVSRILGNPLKPRKHRKHSLARPPPRHLPPSVQSALFALQEIVPPPRRLSPWQFGSHEYVMTRLHDHLQPQPDTARHREDRRLAATIARHQFLRLEHLDAPAGFNGEGAAWMHALRCIQRLEEAKGPAAKAVILWSASKAIFRALRVCLGDEPVGADQLIPVLIYAIVRARPNRLASQLAFCDAFCFPRLLRGEVSYYLLSCQSAVRWLLELEGPEHLRIDPDEYHRCAGAGASPEVVLEEDSPSAGLDPGVV
eukprot:gnl/Dysnectes_brevis/1180_a1317_1739.p1 GENE.gnl/Dysnectes_brevis/1180_a1317_1739~~gnl/Dysnectes_brevis/1180_a1317_1739.p1  ORF type:complete len:370 (-),score=120.63 gnl/Dysnectes_brevis/1180_a1317_1739:86-1195(-)